MYHKLIINRRLSGTRRWKVCAVFYLPYLDNASVVSRKAVVFVDDAFGGDFEDTISCAFDFVVTLDAREVFGDEFADRRVFLHIGLGNWNGLELLHGAFHQRAVLFRLDGADDAVGRDLRDAAFFVGVFQKRLLMDVAAEDDDVAFKKHVQQFEPFFLLFRLAEGDPFDFAAGNGKDRDVRAQEDVACVFVVVQRFLQPRDVGHVAVPENEQIAILFAGEIVVGERRIRLQGFIEIGDESRLDAFFRAFACEFMVARRQIEGEGEMLLDDIQKVSGHLLGHGFRTRVALREITDLERERRAFRCFVRNGEQLVAGGVFAFPCVEIAFRGLVFLGIHVFEISCFMDGPAVVMEVAQPDDVVGAVCGEQVGGGYEQKCDEMGCLHVFSFDDECEMVYSK